MEYLIAECKEDDFKFIGNKQGKDFYFSATNIAKILNTSLSRVVADGDKLAKDIIKKNITHKVFNNKGEIETFHYLSIINEAKYENGTFYFELNYKILPFFINVNKNFTEFQLRHLLSMKTPYAIKLYKILYQYKKIGNRLFSIEDLKIQFGIKDKYPLYKDFRVRVLDKSVEQINLFTDIFIKYDEFKIGKKIHSVKFTIESKQILIEKDILQSSTTIITNDSYTNDFLILIKDLEYKISDSTKEFVYEFYKEKGIEYVESSIAYAQKNAKTNFDKYLQDTLTNNWAEAMIKKNIARKEAESKKIAVENQQKTKKQLELEQNQLNKMQIENEWFKLPHDMQKQYNDFLNVITKKHAVTLTKFPKWVDVLQFCIYAISTERSYDSIIEGYFQKQLNQSLNINQS